MIFQFGRKQIVMDINWKRDCSSPAFFSASTSMLISLMVIGFCRWIHPGPGETFNLVLASYHIGYAFRSRMCEKWHGLSYFNFMADRALKDCLTVIEAERLAKGLKSIHEILYDDNEH